VTTGGQRRRSQKGFATLQGLIVCGIVAMLAGVGLPICVTRAHGVQIGQDVQSLQLQVKSLAAEDLDPMFVGEDPATVVAGGPTDDVCALDGGHLSTSLAAALRSGARGVRGRYVNSASASTVIVCQMAPPSTIGVDRPAVWITADPRYTHAAVADGEAHPELAGTIMVVFHRPAVGSMAVDTYAFDRSGHACGDCSTLNL